MSRAIAIRVPLLLLALATSARAGGAPASATPAAPDTLIAPDAAFEWGVAYASAYSFQGLDYSDGRPVVQPQVTRSFRAVSLGLWANADQSRREWNEVDATLLAERTSGPLSGGLGYAYLQYPHRDWTPTHELLAQFAWSGRIAASAEVHWDVAAGRGGYATLALARERQIRAATASLSAKLYVQDHYYGLTGVPATETAIGLSIPFAGVRLQPSVSRVWAWGNGDFRGEQQIRSRWLANLSVSSP